MGSHRKVSQRHDEQCCSHLFLVDVPHRSRLCIMGRREAASSRFPECFAPSEPRKPPPGAARDREHKFMCSHSRLAIASVPRVGGKCNVAFGQDRSALLRNLAADTPPGPSSVRSSSLADASCLGVPGPECEGLGAGTGFSSC